MIYGCRGDPDLMFLNGDESPGSGNKNGANALSSTNEMELLETEIGRMMANGNILNGNDIKTEIMNSIMDDLYDQVRFLKEEIIFLREESKEKTSEIKYLREELINKKVTATSETDSSIFLNNLMEKSVHNEKDVCDDERRRHVTLRKKRQQISDMNESNEIIVEETLSDNQTYLLTSTVIDETWMKTWVKNDDILANTGCESHINPSAS